MPTFEIIFFYISIGTK